MLPSFLSDPTASPGGTLAILDRSSLVLTVLDRSQSRADRFGPFRCRATVAVRSRSRRPTGGTRCWELSASDRRSVRWEATSPPSTRVCRPTWAGSSWPWWTSSRLPTGRALSSSAVTMDLQREVC